MDFNSFFKEKKTLNSSIRERLSMKSGTEALGLIKLQDKQLIKDLRNGLVILPAKFIIEVEGVNTEKLGTNIIATGKIDSKEIPGFDFIVTDNELKLNKYLLGGVTPIVSKNNTLAHILTEYNPARNEGNSYLYSKIDKWEIYYAITRYLENFKFPFDNKNLVKNILESIK